MEFSSYLKNFFDSVFVNLVDARTNIVVQNGNFCNFLAIHETKITDEYTTKTKKTVICFYPALISPANNNKPHTEPQWQ